MKESEIQRALVLHLTALARPGVVWTATANGAWYGGNPRTGAIMKAMGVRPGVPDILLWHAGKSYALELKTAKGRPSQAQLDYLDSLKATGVHCCIAHGLTEAIAILKGWSLIR